MRDINKLIKRIVHAKVCGLAQEWYMITCMQLTLGQI